jgi:CheY-like chemotaxis protein
MQELSFNNEVPDSVEAFAGGLAHDFNNLLTAIKGRVSLVMNTIKPADPIYHHIMQMILSIDKGSEIAKKLMGIANGDEYYNCSIDVNPIVKNVVEHFKFKKNIALDIDLDPTPLMINADPDKISLVLINIMENAIQAMPTGGKLSIITESVMLLNGTAAAYGLESGSYIKITIVDDGIGMENHMLEKIFNPSFSYWRESRPDTKGQGLAVAKNIIQHHDGVIEVWSTPNIGSSFSIILPSYEIKNKSDTPWEDVAINAKNRTILLVDDEQMILDVGEDFCKALGYSVLKAGSGKEALKIYKKHPGEIDLVILDMMMPEMNGMDLFEALKKYDPDIKVLLSTGYSFGEKIQVMMDRGIKGYLEKPYGFEEISHKLKEIFEK